MGSMHADYGASALNLYDAFGPARWFWDTDITRMPRSWRQCVTLFTEELSWLKGRDLELVMGRAVCDWLDGNDRRYDMRPNNGPFDLHDLDNLARAADIYNMSADQAKYFLDMGVRHFSAGTDITILHQWWKSQGEDLRKALGH
jgi:hypothetical protein